MPIPWNRHPSKTCAYLLGQVAEIIRTDDTFSRCGLLVADPLPVVPVVPVAVPEVAPLVEPLVVSSVPVTSI